LKKWQVTFKIYPQHVSWPSELYKTYKVLDIKLSDRTAQKENVLRLFFDILNGFEKKETMSCVQHVI